MAHPAIADVVAAHLAARFDGAALDARPGLDLAGAYAVAAETERRLVAERGWTRVGRKIGFTNRATWAETGLDTPIWAPVYDATLLTGPATLDVAGLRAPRVEPEIVLGLGRDLAPGAPLEEVAAAVAWVAAGLEVVSSHHGGWHFTPAEAVADFGVHTRLVVGDRWSVPDDLGPAALVRRLEELTATLTLDGAVAATGEGRAVLGGPVRSLAHLAGLPGAAPVRAGEVVTTGTLVPPPVLAAGQRWELAVTGLDLPAVTLTT